MGFNTLVLAQQTTDTIQVGSTQTAHSQNSHNTEAQACTVVKDTLQAPRVLPSLKRETKFVLYASMLSTPLALSTLLAYLRFMHLIASSALLLSLVHSAFLQYTQKAMDNVIQQKTVKPTYLSSVRCQEAGGRKRARGCLYETF